MFNTISPKQTIIAIVSLSVVIIVGAIAITISQIKTNQRLSYLEGKVS